MKRTAYLLLLAAPYLQAADETLPIINVESTTLSDVSGEEVKSADLAEALVKKVPSVSLVRRSGIANDIILRGQKKDNINILIDDAKVYGACPNRMDPPTSHILTNNIDGITITEGPYDVENFGTLSGAVKITTRAPSQELAGEVGVNFGSWGYRKQYATVSGGSDSVRMLISASNESSGQYEDGDGNTFAEQIENFDPTSMSRYKDEYRDQDAYKKQTLMGKVYADLTDTQQLKLSYTANRSDDVLYPSSGMDALYDDSDIFTADYTIRDLGSYSKSLDFQYYDSKVDHPMSTFYRLSSGAGSANEKISALTTHAQGLKVKNRFELDSSSELTLGVDASNRNWDGAYEGTGTQSQVTGVKSINDVDTENRALFAELEKRYAALNLRIGARYDDTSITPDDTVAQQANDYTSVNGFLFATYQASESTRYFGGIGKSSRVPDARELYFRGAMINMGMLMTPEVGTPTLEQTSNTELDLGVEKRYQNASVKAKLFHSWLKDYIYYNADKTMHAFENIDATIYGLSLSGDWFATDTLWMDFGLAWQRGQKDEALAGQSDKDMAEITPLKVNLGLNYDYAPRSSARMEVVAADKWSDFDGDNGEQELDAYSVVNLKVTHAINRNIELTGGVDNVFDKTYAVSNTYQDLTLLSAGGVVMLMNEPGRYLYLNAAYKF
ncbi:MAG TPA: TonB-dependent receptor [Gammaproteobacteria bacterium]